MSKSWQVAEMPSQAGRRAVVTGGNNGIGYPVVLELARRGAEVVIATRNRVRGEDAVERVRREVPGAKVEFGELDLASLASVRAFAERELARGTPLDLLINNAGIPGAPARVETVDGFEIIFGTNVLGHFALTGLLLPALLRAAAKAGASAPRIVTVASIMHRVSRLNFADLHYKTGYSQWKSYGQSKLANLVLALELDRRLNAARLPIQSIAAHPGMASTNFMEAGEFGSFERSVRRWVNRAVRSTLNTAVDGALPTLYAAVAPDAASGAYFGPQGLFEARGGDVGPARIAAQARSEAAAATLWGLCEQMTGVSYLDGAAPVA